MIRSGDVLEPAQLGISARYFHTYDAEYEWILEYHQKYGSAPSKMAFKTAFPDFTLLKADDLGYAVDEVKKNHARFEVTRLLKDATDFLRAGQPIDALQFIQSGTRKLSQDVGNGVKASDVINDWDDLYQDVVERSARASDGGLTGISTGMPTLDGRTYGAQDGDLWLMAARLGQGKTWSLAQMAEAAIVNGHKALFVSLEQTKRQITYRIHTLLSDRFGYELRNTSLSSGINVDLQEYKAFLMELPEKVKGQLIVTDAGRGRVTPITLAAMIEEYEPEVVYIDYITLMATSTGSQAVEDWRAAAAISADVKLVAMQYDIPIIAAAQINRLGDGGNKPPSVSKLAQSDALGQDASVVVTMRRASAHTAQYSLEKNRHGESGAVWWTEFDPDKGRFSEISYEQALDLIIDDEGDTNS